MPKIYLVLFFCLSLISTSICQADNWVEHYLVFRGMDTNRTGKIKVMRYLGTDENYVSDDEAQEDIHYKQLLEDKLYERIFPPSAKQNCVGWVIEYLWDKYNYKTSGGAHEFFQQVINKFAGDITKSNEGYENGDIIVFFNNNDHRAEHVAIVDGYETHPTYGPGYYITSKNNNESLFIIAFTQLYNLNRNNRFESERYIGPETGYYYRVYKMNEPIEVELSNEQVRPQTPCERLDELLNKTQKNNILWQHYYDKGVESNCWPPEGG